MGRPKKAITIVKGAIARMQTPEDWHEVDGMIRMVWLLDKITTEEETALREELESKYEELFY